MKTILTVGVYDMLHIGHILLFEHAKQLGDRLVVAVQDGEYIQKYKPGVKMVYSTEERMYMVRSIKFVDEVVVYRDVDKDIQNIYFDVFAKGPDQTHAGFQRAAKVSGRNESVFSYMLEKVVKNFNLIMQ